MELEGTLTSTTTMAASQYPIKWRRSTFKLLCISLLIEDLYHQNKLQLLTLKGQCIIKSMALGGTHISIAITVVFQPT